MNALGGESPTKSAWAFGIYTTPDIGEHQSETFSCDPLLFPQDLEP